MTTSFYKFLDFSQKRKVFTVGDLHGEFEKLEVALNKLGFNPDTDALVSVGDLVDRGPNSEMFESYLDKPHFHRILGNHDLQPREYLLGYESADAVSGNGGDWFLNKSEEEQERLASVLEDAPLALEVFTPAGHRVGFTHADMHTNWNLLVGECTERSNERYLVNMLTGSRKIIRQVQKHPYLDINWVKVHGIDHVFHGHTPVDVPLTYANRTWIDTMVTDKSDLTVIDVDQWIFDRRWS